jgi:hypothetical protein
LKLDAAEISKRIPNWTTTKKTYTMLTRLLLSKLVAKSLKGTE